MKKLLAILLSLCLLFAIAAPALGESAYSLVQYYLYAEDGCNLGIPTLYTGDWETSSMIVVFDLSKNTIDLGGTNGDGEKEISSWSNVEYANSILTVMKLCAGWETIQGTLEEGYEMGFVLVFGETENDVLYITSQDDANQFYAMVLSWLQGDQTEQAE